MSKLTGVLRDSLRAVALSTVYFSRRADRVVDTQNDLYDLAAATIGFDTPITYLEFGVAHGNSMIGMASRFSNPGSRFYGFDSFLGLPEPWLMHAKGAFNRDGVSPTIDDARVSFVKGWFQNTVPEFLRTLLIPPSHKVLIHYDADLYSSALFLLTSIWPYVNEYYFVMDDFIHDDVVALMDFTDAYPVDLHFIGQTRGGGTTPNPDQVLGFLRRTELVVALPQ